MSTYYIDLYNGSDAASGADWANAWKTITNGATAARIAPGDTIRISKTPDPVSIGNGTWTLNTQASGGFPATKSISSSTNASPIEITTSTAHGYSTGDVVQIVGHPTNTNANGAWVITYVSSTKFTLDGSTGNGTGYSGTSQLINSKAIVLETANNENIERCQNVWSNGTGATSNLSSGTYQKDGAGCNYLQLSSPGSNTMLQYKATGTKDLSAYQYISFWIRNSSAIVDSTTYTITLCSDTAGATVVDTFVIPAIPSTGRWLPLTIARTGGGNLGNSIQSIAVNTGATTPTASSYLLLNNFIATKTNGINLQSLISKNGSAQGGTGAFYGIQSINGKVVLVDNDTNTLSNAGRGYYETSETCTTYIRETFKTALASSSSAVVSELMDSGTLGNLISYEFGYNTSNNTQDGETFLDGLNGNGYGIYASSKSFNSLNWCSTVRYYYGLYLSGSIFNQLKTLSNVNNNASYGAYISSYSCSNIIESITYCNNNNSTGVYFSSSAYNNKINTSNLQNNILYGFDISGSYNIVVNCNIHNNGNYGVIFGASNNNIDTIITTANANASIYNSAHKNFIRSATLNEATQLGTMINGTKAELWSIKEDGVEGNNWGYFYGATANWQTTTKYGTQPGSWKVAITSSDRKSNYKVPLKLAEIACEADKLVTFKCWVKKDHATNVAAQLRVDTDTVNGITGTTTSKADDTNWEELTLTFTPDYQCVAEIYGDSWYVAGTSNVYYGSVTIQQAT